MGGVPQGPEELTSAWCSAAFGSPVEVVEVSTFGEGVGMLSVMARVVLAWPERDAESARPGVATDRPSSVVVKLPPWRARNHGMGTDWGYFLREAEVYRHFGPGLPAPRCHHVAVDPDARLAALVLDDLTASRPLDQVVGASLADAEAVVDTMASLHARWWEHPALERCGFVPALDDGVEDRSARLYRESFPGFAERFRDHVPSGAFRAAERYGPQLATLYHRWAGGGPNTLSHNDLRLDNMLMPAEGAPVFVDWQRVIRYRGASDLAYFVAGSLPVEDRRRHEDRLVVRYHDRLLEAGVQGYGPAALREDYRRSMLRWLGLVSTAAQLDVANARGERLIEVMVERHFTAADDHDVAALLDDGPIP
jgi:hypothetical protein